MRAVHGGKTKNDRIDAFKTASLLRYNLPRPPGALINPGQRASFPKAFRDPILKKSIEADVTVCETYDGLIRYLEKTILRLVKCQKTSAGKRAGRSNAKIGNVHLKWAFSEAALTVLVHFPPSSVTAPGSVPL